MIWWRLQRSLLGQGSYLKILPKRMKWKDRSKNSLCVPNFYINHWIEYLSGTRNKVSSKHCWIRREIAKILNMGFVDGNCECIFYTFVRPNQEQLRKIQLYICPLAGIQPTSEPQVSHFKFPSTKLFEQGKQKKNSSTKKV